MSTDAITEGFDDVTLNEDTQEEVKDIKNKDLALASLSENEGWKQLRGWLEQRRDDYKQMNHIDTSAMSLDEIGQKFVVASLVADEIDTILNRVDTTKAEVDRLVQESATKSKSKKK